MQILWLTQVLPHPADSGAKVRSRLMIEALARDHEVTLLSFVRGDQSRDADALREICRDVLTVPIPRNRAADVGYLALALLTGKPFTIARDDRRAMRTLIERVTAERRFDAVHADQINMAQYASRVPGALRVLDAHNALWVLYQRLHEILPAGLRSFALGHEWRSMRSYESSIVHEFDAVITVSEVDRDALVAPEDRESVSVIPIAVDATAYAVADGSAASRILHIGTMYWPPNVDAVRWFATEVLPLVRRRLPAVGFDVVGTRPPREITRLAENDALIDVPGFVEDLEPWTERAGVFVVPLRAGSGMRVKILEAMARGLPVVTTRIGCEGIEVEHGREVLIADEPTDFANATVRVLEDRRLAAQLAENGRRLVCERYDARRVYGAVTDLYAALAKKVDRSRRAGEP